MESKELLRSIKKFSGINIKDNKSRKRPVIEAKQLYCKLMRDAGHTYQSIGKSINFGHATVLYHFNNYDYIKKFSPDLRALETNVINDLSNKNDSVIVGKINYFKDEVKKLEEILSHSTKNV
jgi:hypothetical protein